MQLLNYPASDPEQMLASVRQLYLERTGERCPKAVENWMRGTAPGVTVRENNYRLCFVLGMDLQQTADFFMRYFGTLAFNYKDSTDAIYYYCLHNRKDFTVIRDMLDRAAHFSTSSVCSTGTLQIRDRIRSFRNDEEFLNYISGHCLNNEMQFQTARRMILEIAKDVQYDLHVNTHSALHSEIMGFNYQRKKRAGTSRVADFPKQYTQSIPTDGVLADILAGKRETYDTLRKTLLIFDLYDFYSFLLNTEQTEMKAEDVRSAWDDFYEQTNCMLQECAFAPLYDNNAFDRAILFCANSLNPIELFRDLNVQRYK
ncbi:MAG: hypothetical protein IKW76_04320 [Clostridia bacterium]|nr:hypothetical protein [Clostridia bacterium]